MLEEEYDAPAVSTFSHFRSNGSRDELVDLLNDLAVILKDRKLMDDDVSLPQRKQTIVRYDDYINRRPVRKYWGNWIDDGYHVAGIHPTTYFPFFLNYLGSAICRLCTGKMDIGEIFSELKMICPLKNDPILLKDLLSFLLLLEEMDLLEFER